MLDNFMFQTETVLRSPLQDWIHDITIMAKKIFVHTLYNK